MGYDIACYVDIINRWVWEIYPDDPVCRIEIWHIRTGVGYRFYSLRIQPLEIMMQNRWRNFF